MRSEYVFGELGDVLGRKKRTTVLQQQNARKPRHKIEFKYANRYAYPQPIKLRIALQLTPYKAVNHQTPCLSLAVSVAMPGPLKNLSQK